LLDDDDVRAFVGEYRIPNALLDVANPTTQGPFAMPDYYFELRHQQLSAMHNALGVFDELADEFGELSGRSYRSLEPYRLDGAEHAIVCLGSSGGTVKDVVDELRGKGEPVGLIEVRSFRPFPGKELCAALRGLTRVAVLDRADSPGGAPPLFAEVSVAGNGVDVDLRSYVYGLGGRDLHPEDVKTIFHDELVGRYLGLRGESCPD
jgi:pyruvate ferredoxin oxidoreductase alpha subunit